MTLPCPRDDCSGSVDLGDVDVVTFDLCGEWTCDRCGQECHLPVSYIDHENTKTWWLVETDQ